MENETATSTPPKTHYPLDTHVDSGITNPDGAVAKIPHVLADLVWTLDRMLVGAVLDLFGWSFQLDLLNGTDGALAPVGEAMTALYADTVGQNFLTAAVVIAGIWALFHALVRRDYATATGRLGLSLILIVAALFVVRAPEQTIGGVSQWSNEFSAAALSGLSAGKDSGPDAVQRSLHEQFIHQPWLVLNFGGLEVCTDLDGNRVEPDATESKLCRPTDTPNAAGRGGYGQRFLKYRPGSDERDNEYRALAEGRLDVGANRIPGIDIGPVDITPGIGPRSTPDQFEPGYVVDDRDKAAVEIQQRGAGSERFVMALLIFAGTLGAVLLIGLLSLAVILAQVIALLIAAFAPVALIAGAIPGRGHAIFFEWAKGLIGALIAKAVLSLVLVVVLTVGAAVSGAVAELGFVMAFGLTAAFYWVAFMARRRVFGVLQTVASVSGVPTIALGRGRARVRFGGGQPPRRGGRGWQPDVSRGETNDEGERANERQGVARDHESGQRPPTVARRTSTLAGVSSVAPGTAPLAERPISHGTHARDRGGTQTAPSPPQAPGRQPPARQAGGQQLSPPMTRRAEPSSRERGTGNSPTTAPSSGAGTPPVQREPSRSFGPTARPEDRRESETHPTGVRRAEATTPPPSASMRNGSPATRPSLSEKSTPTTSEQSAGERASPRPAPPRSNASPPVARRDQGRGV